MELLELTWPPVTPTDDEETLRATCLCYAVMRRPGGFLLCLPTGFLPADTLRAGEEANVSDLVGLSVPPISLTDDGEWVRPTDTTPVAALIVDFADAGAECLSQADTFLTGAAPFSLERPGIFPLASDVLRQARLWAATGAQTDRSGYQTAVSEPTGPRQAKANPKPKRPTCSRLPQPSWGCCLEPPCAAASRPKNDPTRSVGAPAKASGSSCARCPSGPSRGGAYWHDRRFRRFASAGSSLQLFPGRGHAPSVQGPECFGFSACTGPGPTGCRPHFNHGQPFDKGHLSQTEVAGRALPSRRLFRKAPQADCPSTDLPHHGRRDRAGPDDPLLRKIRRIWKPKAPRSSPVPAGSSERPPGARLHCRGLGPSGPAYYNGRPGERRWWQARPGFSLQPAAGSPSGSFREPPVVADGRLAAFLTPSRCQTGRINPRICQRNRDSVEPAPRVRGPTKEAGGPALSPEVAYDSARQCRPKRRARPDEEAVASKGLGNTTGCRGKLRSPADYKAPRCAEQPHVPLRRRPCIPGAGLAPVCPKRPPQVHPVQ